MTETVQAAQTETDVFGPRIAEALRTPFRVTCVSMSRHAGLPSGFAAILTRYGTPVASLRAEGYGEPPEVVAIDGYDTERIRAELGELALAVRPAHLFVEALALRLSTNLLVSDLVEHADIAKKMSAKRGLVFLLAEDGDFWTGRSCRQAPARETDVARARLAVTPGARVWDKTVGDFVAA